MSFVHQIKKLALGDTLVVPDGDVLAGTNLEADGRGGFVIVAHLLARNDGVAITQASTRELAQ
jgi:hypothetical protein